MNLTKLVVGLILVVLTGVVSAAERIALVIGNQNYHKTELRLKQPLKDAQSMMNVLRQNKFHIYGGRVQANLGRQHFENTVRQFAQQARGAKVAVVYYAGHGAQDGKANYLIPTDADIVLESKKEL